MLGNDRFVFETPNVIDPGDLPPSRPSREEESKKTNLPRHVGNGSSAIGPSTKILETGSDYNQARESAARLLRDIADLDLTPVAPAPYDPYDDEDDDEHHHSLPITRTPNKDRFKLKHATKLTKIETQPLSSTVTIKLHDGKASSNLVRNQCLHYIKPFSKIICVVIGIAAFAGVIFGSSALIHVVQNDNGDDNSNGTTQSGGSSTSHKGTSTPRFLALIRLLDESGISNADDLTSSTSPQYKAAYWIANDDGEQRNIPETISLSNDPDRIIQRYALAVFYWATGGPDHWRNTLSFNTAADECAWSLDEAVPQFISKQYVVGVGCDTDLKVRTLFIPGNGLSGTLPDEIRLLNNINLLALPSNELSSAIPDALSQLPELQYLDLNYNNFSGSIPEFIGDFENLEVLGLSDNKLSGIVPNTIGTLGNLQTLSLDDNSLAGDISFAKHMGSLKYLYLDQNGFTGELDDSFFIGLPMLRELDISDNNLEGYLNLSLVFDHEYLHVVDLAQNNFTGLFPPSISENVNLQYLSLRDNNMNGTIGADIMALTQLTHLDLHGNMFTGDIPNQLGGMSRLTYLFLGKNKFDSSRIPPLSQLTALRELSMSQLGLTEVPQWLFYLKSLQLLDLSHNNISGSITDSVWNLPNLQYLILNDNKLSGVIPNTEAGGKKLKFLAVHRNNITGDADHVCGGSPDLSAIATDCSVSCAVSCCSSCCAANDETCFVKETAEYMVGVEGSWELKYKRASFSFDPDILEQAALFQIISDP